MENRLAEYRFMYENARFKLGTFNKLRAGKQQKSTAMIKLNKARHTLLMEMQRVSWALWPQTGRPYTGEWQVTTRPNECLGREEGLSIFIGSMLRCIAFIERARYGMGYYIRKLEKDKS